MAEIVLFVLFLLVGVGGTLALYALVERETSNPRIADRREAQREAQARGGTDAGTGRRGARDDSSGADVARERGRDRERDR